jgi:membrane-associated phospholipid phosphatase
MARALAATAAALAAFTIVVVAGGMTAIDEWAVDHVMPGLDPRSHGGIVHFTGLWRPFPLDAAWWDQALDTYLYPASFLVSALIAGACCWALARRGDRAAAVVWLGAWLAANAIEFAGKVILAKPDVHWSNGPRPVHVTTFDHSYPSGHTTRAVVLAALLAYTFPRARALFAAWVLVVPAGLVVVGAHTVSDVAGGMLLGLAVVLAAHAIMRTWTRWPISSNGSSGGSSLTRRPSSPTSQAPRSASRTPS